ncbi:MAG: hypothetical protein ABSA13_17545 [Beijerinckiaceae bacterium]|jgi:hypothetical protein
MSEQNLNHTDVDTIFEQVRARQVLVAGRIAAVSAPLARAFPAAFWTIARMNSPELTANAMRWLAADRFNPF